MLNLEDINFDLVTKKLWQNTCGKKRTRTQMYVTLQKIITAEHPSANTAVVRTIWSMFCELGVLKWRRGWWATYAADRFAAMESPR